MTPIFFLDFDGVMLSFAESAKQKLTWDDREKVVFDKTAIDLFNKLLNDFDAEYVLSTSWSNGDKPSCERILTKNNIDISRLNKDWRTPKRFTSDRIHEINMWLDDHKDTTVWICLDDDITVTRLPKEHVVHIVMENDNSIFNKEYYKEAETKLMSQINGSKESV